MRISTVEVFEASTEGTSSKFYILRQLIHIILR